jgi:hypothetical protein
VKVASCFEALRRFIRGLPRAENCLDEHHGLACDTASSETGTSRTCHLCSDGHRPRLARTARTGFPRRLASPTGRPRHDRQPRPAIGLLPKTGDWRLTTAFPNAARFPGAFRNPVVHSLLVTLSNHAILGYQPYNCPCWPDYPSRQWTGGPFRPDRRRSQLS